MSQNTLSLATFAKSSVYEYSKFNPLPSIETSVSGPDSMIQDSDPAFQAEYKSGSGSRVWMIKNEFNIFVIQKCNLRGVFLGLHKGRPSYSRSLQPSKENIQHFKT